MTAQHTIAAIAVVAMLGGVVNAQQGRGGAQPAGQPPTMAAPAPPPKLPAELHPDISGIWNRVDDIGAGSWDGLMRAFEEAQLQPEYAAKLPARQFGGTGTPPPGFVPQPYDINAQTPAATRCAVGGGGFNAGGGGINIDSSGMSLMVGLDEVLMLRDGAQGARRIRLDGKGFPDATRMNGLFSIGRWDGGSLVVTTRGFTSGQVQYGRGWTEPSTELTETFTLLHGDRLIITYTYSDPKVYIKPHTYALAFDRLPRNVNILEGWCDSKEWIEWNKKQAAPAAPGAAQRRDAVGAAFAERRPIMTGKRHMTRAINMIGASICASVISLGALIAQGGQGAAPAPAGGLGVGGGQGGGGRGGGRGGRGAAEPIIPVNPHDLSGFWLLPPDPRDGRNVPAGSLAAGVTKAKLDQIAKHDKDAVRYCNPMGLPAMMALGTPYDIKISPTLMVIVTEYAAAQNRWIYLNREKHTPADDYDPSTYGESIGHWDGDTLVLETTMMDPEKGILGIPGGGFRTADSKLVERFKLLKSGQVLSVVSTWTDPKVFRTPQTYEYRYNRMTRDYEGRLGSGCDPYDDERTAFLSGPPGAVR